MKLILTHEVTGLGTAGDVVEVKDGYARNFLLPRGLATPWTKGGQKQVDAITKGREVREIKHLEEAKQRQGPPRGHAGQGAGQGRPVRPSVRRRQRRRHRRRGQGRRWPGARPAQDRGPAARSSRLGSYEALVRLHPEVQATVTFEVVAG